MSNEINEKDNLEPQDSTLQNEVLEPETGAEDTEVKTPEAESDDASTRALQGQVDELKDKFLRLSAEFDNYKRRTARERMELLSTAAKDTLVAFISIADDFERALKAAENATDVSAVKEGVLLIQQRFLGILKQKGVQELDSTGTDFNSELHEAITEIPAGDEMKGKVVDTVEKGYSLHDKIIRYAKVVVGK